MTELDQPPTGASACGPQRVVRRRVAWGVGLVLAGLVVAAVTVAVRSGASLPDVDALLSRAAAALGAWSYALVAGLAFLETGAFVGLLVPGETSMVLGGALAARGELAVAVLLPLVWASCLLGDVVSFLLGRRLGRDWVLRHGPRVRISAERLARVERYFARHGGKTIVIGRFVGLVRVLAPFLAGASGLPLRRFLPFSVVGTGLFAAFFLGVGYVFYASIAKAADTASHLALAVAVALGAAALGWSLLHRRRTAA